MGLEVVGGGIEEEKEKCESIGHRPLWSRRTALPPQLQSPMTLWDPWMTSYLKSQEAEKFQKH